MTPPVAASGPGTSSDAAFAELVEELTARLQAGGDFDVEAYLREHAEHAGRLRDLLPALRMLAELSESASSAAAFPGPLPDGPAAGTLGDFRIVREVGRGGMGIVYEAEQISLGRRVALKVLPFAAAMDPRQLQRFKNEARAAASLRHEHIVQVHAVGCERGLHFIAMDFIKGATLACLIRDAHNPESVPAEAADAGTPPAGEAAPTLRAAGLTTEGGRRGPAFYRAAARLVAQAAEALEYAHSLGVVHRDVKPGNLLVDESGKVWVADFGLARFGTDAGLTASGDLLGTLRYMSPEQALAKHGLVDHRADVYALGATLYELLTLRPAFPGSDRQDLLRQIAFEEPKAPQRLERAVPAELETIVLKALEKNPADRYATAKELADDLRRFLEDRPIRARRPSLRQVTYRWARRHRAVVWAAAVCLLVTAVLGGGTWVSWAQRLAEARAALDEAKRLLPQERWSEALSAARRAAGVLAGVGPNAGLRRQAEELSKDVEMALRLQEAHLQVTALKDGHFDREAGRAAYAEAFRWYGLNADSLDPREVGKRIRGRPVHRQLVAALDHWAVLAREEGHKSWTWAAAAARAADPDEWRDRLRDAWGRGDSSAVEELLLSAPAEGMSSALWLTLPCLHRNEITTSEREIITLLRRAQERHPDDFWANHNLASYLHNRRPPQLEEIIRYYSIAVSLRPRSPGARLNLGNALKDRGDLDGAIVQYREAIHLNAGYAEAHRNLGAALQNDGKLDEAVAECREAIRLKPDLAEAHGTLGNALDLKGLVGEAIGEYREALRLKPNYLEARLDLGRTLAVKGLLGEAIAEYREALRVKPDHPEAHLDLGLALHHVGNQDAAIAEFRKALRLKSDLPVAHYSLGLALQRKGQQDEAITEYREALRLTPDDPKAHYTLGGALVEKGLLDESIAECQKALRLKADCPDAHYHLGEALQTKGLVDEAIAAYKKAILLRPVYAEAHGNLGTVLWAKDLRDEALREYREALRLKPDSAMGHNNLGNAFHQMGRLDEAIPEYREAIRLQGDFPLAHCNLGNALLQRGQFRDAVEALRRGHQLGSLNPHWTYPSAQLLREAEQMAELDDRLSAILEGKDRPKDAAERLAFARLCQEHRKRYAAAERFYQESFAAQPALAEDLGSGNRYNAACAAALAGCGQGQDAAGLDDKERARLRRQALDWLHADLGAWRRLLEKEPDKARPAIAKTMQHWLGDEDFASVRDEAAFAKLPEAERPQWQALWAEVESLRRRAAGPAGPPTDTRPQGKEGSPTKP